MWKSRQKLTICLTAVFLLLSLSAYQSGGQASGGGSASDTDSVMENSSGTGGSPVFEDEDGSYLHVTADNTVQDVIDHPAFEGFGGYILTSGDEDSHYADNTLDNISSLLPYHSHIDTNTTVNSINYLIDEVNKGRTIFYDYYSATEKEEDSEKELTGLLFFRGKPGAPFAVVSPGGGFSYNGSVHEGFPYAIEMAKRGYNAFVIYYRMRGGVSSGEGVASEDLSAAVSYILSHAEELEVGTEDYSVWGSSAGAIMSANVGSKGPAHYGYDVEKPCCVVMASGYGGIAGNDEI